MMGFLRVLALLVLFCGLGVAQPRSAPPTATQKADIDRLAKRAITKSQANDHEGAIKDLLDAYAIHPGAANILLSNVGHEYKQIKKPYDALKYFCMYLSNEPAGSAASYVKAETEVLKKELKLEGEPCAAKPEPVKPDPPKPDPTNPDPNGQVTGTKTIDKSPKRSAGGGLKVAGIGVGVVGVAVLAGGFVYGSKAQEKSDAITKGPPPVTAGCDDPDPMVCPRIGWDPPDPTRDWEGLSALDRDGKKYEKLQIAFTVAGGAMIVTGVAMYFLGRSKSSRSEIRVAPTAGRDNAGLTLVGGF
jgi:hypothetical protein